MTIAPNSINPLTLPYVPLEQRYRLPETPCVYFAINSKGVVQYIGQSTNPRKRWVSHHKGVDLALMGGIRIAYLEVSDSDLLSQIESALVQWFQPPLNYRASPKHGSATQSPIRCRLAVLMAEKFPRFSRRQLADETGLDIAIINELYTGSFERIDASTISALCNYFRVDVGSLLEIRKRKS